MRDETQCRAPRQWRRTARAEAYDSPQRARYPSIARGLDQALLLMLTCQTAEQEGRQCGDLLLVRSIDEGHTWSQPTKVYAGGDGEPRAIGTMTVLQSGRIIAPLAKLKVAQSCSDIHMISSMDDGKTWSAMTPEVDSPLVWQVPTGRVIEVEDGLLAMAVFGAKTENDLKGTIHNCGFLRSTDDGETWGDFSYIAMANGPVLGAVDRSQFSMEAPSVVALADDHWLAMVTARRLGAGPGAPQVLCRLRSHDKGRTWSLPDQIAIGAWSSMVAVDGQTTVCPYSDWSAWGGVACLVSDDGFDSFHQNQLAMLWGWTEGRSRANVNEEVPSPPTVPYLGAEHWPFEHYGFPSVVEMGEDRYAVALARTRKGSIYVDPHLRDIPVEAERIEVVFFERPARPANTITQRQHIVPSPSCLARQGRWVLAERFNTISLTAIIQMPDLDLLAISTDKSFCRSNDGGRTWGQIKGSSLEGIESHPSIFGITKAGRWLLVCGHNVSEGETKRTVVGHRGGYQVVKHSSSGLDRWAYAYYSNDEGSTWQGGQEVRAPAVNLWPDRGFYEAPNGDISFSTYSCMTAQHAAAYAASSVLFRSRDGGITWDDHTVIAGPLAMGQHDPHPDPRYTETAIVPLPDGQWLAMVRTEYGAQGPDSRMAELSRTVSRDFGHTWSPPQRVMISPSQHQLVLLPDNALALVQRSHSWQQPGVCISYDFGITWRYAMAGPYSMGWAFLTADNELVVIAGDGLASRYVRRSNA